MGWIVVIIIIIIVLNGIARSGKGRASSGSKDNFFVIDDQDPDNPMFEEMQEEFFDEFEDERDLE